MPKAPRFRLLLVAGGFIAGIAATVFYLREPTEPLTDSALQQARDLWRHAEIKDYDLKYRMHGSVYDVHVRGGIVTDVRVDGLLPNSTNWKLYSVDGLFDVLGLEVEMYGNKGAGSSTILRVRFNRDLGFVEHYVRGGSAGNNSMIQTLSFSQSR